MSRIIGIDLGTTNSSVAIVDSGIPLVLAGMDGQRLTPSVVSYPDGAAEPVAGYKANRLRALLPAQTVYSIKRFMGRRGNEAGAESISVPYPVTTDDSGSLVIAVPGRRLTPEQISAEILKKLKGDAESALGEPISRAVITVPAYFNDAQRNATKRAGELAGLTVERILNEPTAAALAYGLDKLGEKSKIAVYDLGGGTFDLSILELHEGVFQVLATHGDTRLGGDDLDQRVVGWILEKARSAGAVDPTRDLALMARIRGAAEEAKIRLSSELEVEIALPFITPTVSLSCRLTRAELEDLTRDLIQRTRAHCLRALADAKLETNDLDQVILVGGQTRMPLVRRMVAEWFGCVDFEPATGAIHADSDRHRGTGPMLNTSQNPEEAVALGAAVQAEILSGGLQNMLLLDVTPLSLGLETFGGLMNVIIPRNSTIPTKAGEVFTTAVDYQTSMLIHVLQGERERAPDNWSLGRFTIEFARAPKGMARVGVQFEIDADGILQVLARDLKTGHEQVVRMKSAVDVNNADVQKMVEESVAHAFDDLRSRQWIESRLRAQETVLLARNGLAECNEITSDDRQRIEVAIQAVTAALGTENTATQAGDLPALKSSLGDLDRATQPLADALMQKALDDLLRKRGVGPT